ncbi:Zinc finger CCCH domain-containing protein 31 [Paragonimus heterotremus]|uniref:Zinc finger CCCH domain-containing protein 31 n=1 Tax=Paragonimus heterotremus TaxID=100268 RepID=A0A8J4SXJ0_9TREM|nr:Zinc finger CCCH domain-containing protein 31 [Paragonimus heterotremus]
MDAVPTAVMSRMTQELNYRESAGQQNITKLDSVEQNYTLMPINGRSNGNMANEIEIYCGSCKRVLERQGNESYCTLLKDHYLECFLDKEGDHVKYVKTKAALEPGQMYWCKSCILIFEKPWSLFQHMADKAKGSKVQRWEKKIHLDWLDNVAGLMAGYDLGLFSPAKLRIDLRNLLADQHTVEEEMEAAAVTAAAMMQWLAPLSSPWRLQQREMMRKIEQLNRQMLRKANLGLNGPSGGYPLRAALTAAPASATTSPSINYMGTNRPTTSSLPATPAPPLSSAPNQQRIPEMTISDTRTEVAIAKFPTKCAISQVDGEQPVAHRSSEIESKDNNDSAFVGPLGDGNSTRQVVEEAMLSTNETTGSTGAAGDTVASSSEQSTPKHPSESTEVTEQPESSNSVVDSNNTNSVHTREHLFGRSDDSGRRVEFKRGYNSAPVYGYSGSKLSNSGGPSSGSKGYNDSMRYQVHSRGSRTPGYGHSATSLSTANHRAAMYRANRLGSGPSVPPSRGANTFNPPSFHASLDFNCGFTDEEVEELLSQGIRPWDSEAAAALAVLHGELDHLLD